MLNFILAPFGIWNFSELNILYMHEKHAIEGKQIDIINLIYNKIASLYSTFSTTDNCVYIRPY